MSGCKEFLNMSTCLEPFSSGVKKQARDKANNRCEACGKKGSLEVHHEIPQVFKGKDNIGNAKVLCRKCHERADFNVIEYGIDMNGVTLNQLPEFRFKNNYNPFKDLEIEKINLGWRHDSMMIKVGKHTREYYDSHQTKKHKKHKH